MSKRRPKTIVEKHGANFETLRRAFAAGHVASVACKLRATGEEVAVLCAMAELEDGDVHMTPFAMFFNGNPFELLVSPLEEDEGRKP